MSLLQFLKKFLRRHTEGILLKNAADDDHRMRPHDIHHGVTAEFGKILDADDSVIVTAPDVIDPRLEFDQVVDAGRSPARPFHLTNDSAERVWSLDRATRDTLEHLKHAVLIEPAILEIHVSIDAKFQLAAALCRRNVNSGSGQMPDVTVATIGTDDVDRFMDAAEAILDDGQQNTIFFVLTIEDCADVASQIQLGASKWY